MAGNIRIKQPASRLMSFGPIALILLIAMSVAFWFGTKSVSIPFLGTKKLANVTDKSEKIKLLEKLNNQLKHEVALVER